METPETEVEPATEAPAPAAETPAEGIREGTPDNPLTPPAA